MICHGLDIIEVARIRQAAKRWGARFLKRVFTPEELADCGMDGPTPHYESLAARWAAKEAAAKALVSRASDRAGGTVGVRLREIEVVRGPAGQPSLRLHGATAALAETLGLISLSLSLSHTHDHAVASVIGVMSGERCPPDRDRTA